MNSEGVVAVGRPTTGKLSDPAWRTERARNAARARTTTEAHIAALVESAPALTDEQADLLRSLLPPPGNPDPLPASAASSGGIQPDTS